MDEYLTDIVKTFAQFNDIYGQGFPEPLIAVTDIVVNKNDIQIMGKNHDTVKFVKNDMSYLIFRAKDLVEELETGFDKLLNFTIIGKANLNEWGGSLSPQILVNNYELAPVEMEF